MRRIARAFISCFLLQTTAELTPRRKQSTKRPYKRLVPAGQPWPASHRVPVRPQRARHRQLVLQPVAGRAVLVVLVGAQPQHQLRERRLAAVHQADAQADDVTHRPAAVAMVTGLAVQQHLWRTETERFEL